MYKQVIAFFNVDNDFFKCVLGIVLIYIAQTLFKISKSRHENDFSWQKLFDGILNYAIYFLGVVVLFFAGEIFPNAKIIIFNNEMTLVDALTLLALVLFIKQSTKALKNIMDNFQLTDKDIQIINDKEATFKGDEG